MAVECRECKMTFETQAALLNHRNNFCTASDWVDLEVMRKQLENEQAGHTIDHSKELSFAEVKSYLKRRAHGDNIVLGDVGGQTLASLRAGIQNGDSELEDMHRLVMQQRAQEKANELKQLKVRQQKIRAQRNQDEREIRDLMRDLEKRKEVRDLLNIFGEC